MNNNLKPFYNTSYSLSESLNIFHNKINEIIDYLNCLSENGINKEDLDKIKEEIVNLSLNKIDYNDIIDNLEGGTPTQVLSAKQGKVLKDLIAEGIRNYDTEIEDIYTKLNKAIVDIKSLNKLVFELSTLVSNIEDEQTKQGKEIDKLNSEILNYLNSKSLDRDSNGVYTKVEYSNALGKLIMTSLLSEGTSPYYTKMTWFYFDDKGVQTATRQWSLSYDENNKIVRRINTYVEL